jgi:hypothetical protein
MYIIYFEDGDIFKGGNPNNSKWNEIPNKTIKKIQYILMGKTVYLENYNKYNHIVERYNLLNKKTSGISKVLLMGEKAGVVKRFVFDLLHNCFYEDITEVGKEYNNNPVLGWKKGVIIP